MADEPPATKSEREWLAQQRAIGLERAKRQADTNARYWRVIEALRLLGVDARELHAYFKALDEE